MLRTASASGVVLTLQCRSLKVFGFDIVRAGAHVSCASATVRHTANWTVGQFGFVKHVCGRAGQAQYMGVAFGGTSKYDVVMRCVDAHLRGLLRE